MIIFSLRQNRSHNDFSIELADEWHSRDQRIANVIDYFQSKTAGARLPSRADVDPLQLKEYLPEIALFKIIYDGDELDDIHVSLSGTRLDEFYGAIKSYKIDKKSNPVVLERIMQSCQYCVKVRAPIVVTANALAPNKDFAKITILYVPLSADNDRIDQIFVFNQVQFKNSSR